MVEDDAAFAEMLQVSLASVFELTWCQNSSEASVQLLSRKFDLVLCDHMLPDGMQGLEYLTQLRASVPAMRRILLTGYINPEMISRAMSIAGLSAVLVKPIPTEQLMQELKSALERPVP